ncbi:SUMF1/EgtB/PvdO family nonheme iron enzyme [Streptomyces sp. NPDC004539]|uniref:SUMF1/EgtB/PvdO family nonheme iron enzyme n=1 Tax=Streptomyces sp. NPDC004539 TaxID=3154280 RepID=UPI0033BE2729
MSLLSGIQRIDEHALGPKLGHEDFRGLVHDYVGVIASARPGDVSDLAPVGAMHPWPWVRVAVLRRLAHLAPKNQATRELARWLTHDYDDFVAFEALQVAGAVAGEDAVGDLILIVGEAGKRITHHSGKPVGIGHAVALEAIQAIVFRGNKSPRRLEELERELFPEGRRKPDRLPEVHGPVFRTGGHGFHGHDGMSFIPAGPVTMGIPPSWRSRELLFDWKDDPGSTVQVKEFHIDKLPVTVAEYDTFSFGEAALTHEFCHPSEAPGKLHWRNTLTDDRVAPDHPVTGVDWFDAYAYARWTGKRLPAECEWQRAAQGPDGSPFPWGHEFDPAAAHCVSHIDLTRGWETIREWRAHLLGLLDEPTPSTTAPVAARGTSPFGVHDMSGNSWEWTSSAYSGEPATPGDGSRDAVDVVYDATSYAVIKGGAWTSLPEQVSASFRGRDLLFDRHFEIGFRCVCDCVAR